MSIGTLDVIERLPFELQARLQADEYFCDIPVVVWEEGKTGQLIKARQGVLTTMPGGKRGICVIVLQVVGDDEFPNVAFGPLTLRPAFQVVELVELNRDTNGTGKSARRVARRIRDVIKPLALIGLTTEFIPDKPCIEPVNLGKDLGEQVKAYQVNFLTWECDTQGVAQVLIPAVTSLAPEPQVALSSETAGADIWYTLDESFPIPTTMLTTSTALQYRGDPINLPVGTSIIRAAAYKSGMIGSQVNRAEVVVS